MRRSWDFAHLLLFGYFFSSSIHLPGGNYRVATDMAEGVIDRFKVLPIAGPRF